MGSKDTSKISVFIIDDHQMFINGIQSMFVNHARIRIIGASTSGNEALRQLKKSVPDVVLLDINLPDMDGIELNKLLHQKFPQIKVIALTMHHEASFIQTMIRHGARAYVLKNSGQEQLQQAIITVAAGDTYFGEEVKEALMQGILPESKTSHTMIPRLSRREREVLELIIQEFTTQEIADKLFISQNTVETHRKNLLQKLNVRNTAGLVRFAIEKGLVD
ncbi:DNA-binding NarL/FixJ family response regulator [Catalinimonas alkaloidigena]|uniref:response regulator n=1 Tax=Catalinimonas alkaloidigena TaxID=1075417 RepID=UPI0024064AEB|nr:response regulator transcription factor [Catalinimonas alkaloidigena]MDF9794769.1 DNA-binding NarL/FixJ family response regulator [Catalinimonas alkaloidigena]